MWISSINTAFAIVYVLQSLSGSQAMNLCDGSNNAQYTGSNVDGSGAWVGSDKVTHPYKFPEIRKCWYDYYVTNSSLYNADWVKSSGDTDCNSYTCTVSQLSGTQKCQTQTSTISIGISVELPKVVPNEIASPEIGVDYTLSQENSYCTTASSLNACQWNDGQCHTVFTSQEMLRQDGYRRQRCDWGHGDETQCMDDFTDFDTPTEHTNYQCGAECNNTNMVIIYTSTSSAIQSTTTQSASTTTKSETSTIISTFVPPTTLASTTSTTAPAAIASASETPLTPDIAESTKSASKFSPGAKIGVGFGTVALVTVLTALLMWACTRNRDGKPRSEYGLDEPAYVSEKMPR